MFKLGLATFLKRGRSPGGGETERGCAIQTHASDGACLKRVQYVVSRVRGLRECR